MRILYTILGLFFAATTSYNTNAVDSVSYDQPHLVCDNEGEILYIKVSTVAESEETYNEEDYYYYEETEEENYYEEVEESYLEEEQEEEEEKEYIDTNDYSVASYIYYSLINDGYSAAAASGILGNLMRETGGDTLWLDPYCYYQNFYGLAQWSLTYYPEVDGTDLEWQVDFLLNTIEEEYDAYGYKSGYTYEEFKSISDPSDAALSFAQTYERCSSAGYGKRQNNAWIAYEYFN